MAHGQPPALKFIFRFDVEMSTGSEQVGAPFGGSQYRIILPIAGGKFEGPNIKGEIVPNSGADYATRIVGAGHSQLDARYVLKTDDGHLIYVQSRGISNNIDWFTRLELETGPGPYNWLNSIFAIGQLSKTGNTIYIDVYQVTKAPDEPAESRMAKI